GIQKRAGSAIDGVVVIVHRQRLGKRRPGTDIQPAHRHFDDDDLRFALAVGGGLHHGEIDRDLFQPGIEVFEDFFLTGCAPGGGDFGQELVVFREVDAQLVEDSVAAPDEHAAVPVVPAGFDVAVGGGLVGLFAEHLHAVSAGGAPADGQR